MSKLYNVLEQIIDKVNKSVKFEEGQVLTEEERKIVLTNLGISTDVDPTPPSSDDIVTEYTYEYDGNTDSEDNVWITNYTGVKVFAKMGELPKGTINLVGATLFRTNPSNGWLDKTFTITEEHLTKVLHKAETDIPAKQDGLIQIYDMMASDYSEFTVLCICTRAGWYNVCFDDWYEIINFPETGIYAYDKRTYGGSDYLKTFTFTVTSSPSNPDNPGDIDTTTPTNYEGNEITNVNNRNNNVNTYKYNTLIDSINRGTVDNGINRL